MFSVRPVFFLPVLLSFLLSCEGAAEKKRDLRKELPGKWQHTFLKITMNSFNNTDSTRVVAIREEDWETVMHMQPIVTVYFSDGTYFSEHRNLNDSVVYLPFGKWQITGDSILMQDTFPQTGPTYRYHLGMNQGLMECTGYEDSDGDGQSDDLYYSLQRRLDQ